MMRVEHYERMAAGFEHERRDSTPAFLLASPAPALARLAYEQFPNWEPESWREFFFLLWERERIERPSPEFRAFYDLERRLLRDTKRFGVLTPAQERVLAAIEAVRGPGPGYKCGSVEESWERADVRGLPQWRKPVSILRGLLNPVGQLSCNTVDGIRVDVKTPVPRPHLLPVLKRLACPPPPNLARREIKERVCGLLDGRRLAYDNPFKVRLPISEKRKAVLLLDDSASLGRLDELDPRIPKFHIIRAAASMIDVMDVWGHSGHDTCELYHYPDLLSLTHYGQGEQNYDHVAVESLPRPMFVITDGRPKGINYGPPKSVDMLLKSCQRGDVFLLNFVPNSQGMLYTYPVRLESLTEDLQEILDR